MKKFKNRCLQLVLLMVTALMGGVEAQSKSPQDKPTAANEQAGDGSDELFKDLVSSIAANDAVAYAQCWTSLHHQRTGMKKLFPNATEQDALRFVNKIRRRNNAIHHSFAIIRKQIDDPSSEIRFISVEVKDKRTETFRGVSSKGLNMITCRFKVGDHDWSLILDDAVFVNGRWLLGDDPIELETHEKRIGLRMHKGEYGRVIEIKSD